MKRFLMVVILGLVVQLSEAAAPYMVPVGTNVVNSTNAWWVMKPGTNRLDGWEAWYTMNTNFAWVQQQFGGMSDAQTNAMLNSFKQVAVSTNGFSVPYGGTNVLPFLITNYAGCSYTITQGSPRMWFSLDYGTNWSYGGETLVTTGVVKLRFTVDQIPMMGPITGVVTNFTAYRMTRPDLFGRTNAAYGMNIRLGRPSHPDDAANKDYVDGLFNATAWWTASRDVDLNGNALNLSATWQLKATGGTNDQVTLQWLGENVFKSTVEAPVTVTNVSLAVDGIGTNCVVTVPTNGLASAPRLQVTHSLEPATWIWLAATPAVTGTNYVFTFGFPYSDHGFFLVAVPSSLPGAFTLAQLLQLSPRTITNRTDTTWGYGAGLVCVDSNYLYLSVGSNSWKRVAVGTW